MTTTQPTDRRGQASAYRLLTEAGDWLEQRGHYTAAAHTSAWCFAHQLGDSPLATLAAQLHQQRRAAAYSMIHREV